MLLNLGLVPNQKLQKKRLDFPAGRWFQFFTSEDGIAAIPYKTLSKVLDDVDEVDPRSFSVYMSSNLGRSKTQSFNTSIEENLVEISISVEGEIDSSFDNDDKIIFYGRGPSGFDFQNNMQFGTKIYILVQIHAGFSYLTINQKEEKESILLVLHNLGF